MGYKPTNKYLPPRARRDQQTFAEPLPKSDGSALEKLFAWADRLMTSAKASARANETDLSDRLEG